MLTAEMLTAGEGETDAIRVKYDSYPKAIKVSVNKVSRDQPEVSYKRYSLAKIL